MSSEAKSAKLPVDWSLYLVAYPEACRGRSVRRVVEAAVRGGVSAVQLRCKDVSAREYLAIARALHEFLAGRNVPLLVNDRVDVALAAGAEGVHVGQADMPAQDARRLMGSDALIGLSVGTPQEARAAQNAPVDYLGVGPIYPTTTKAGTPPQWGCRGLRKLRDAVDTALVGIGGITESNAWHVVEAGADGIAVVSAICSADDPEQAARRLRQAVESARKRAR